MIFSSYVSEADNSYESYKLLEISACYVKAKNSAACKLSPTGETTLREDSVHLLKVTQR
jgi:hypothetical protein